MTQKSDQIQILSSDTYPDSTSQSPIRNYNTYSRRAVDYPRDIVMAPNLDDYYSD